MEPQQEAKDNTIWPALSAEEDEWEMVPTNTSAPLSPVVTFDPSVLDNTSDASETNPNIIHHSASSPDLRHLKWADDDESGVVVSKEEEDASSSLASSAVLVSGPASVWSLGSNKLSFRDAMLQNRSTTASTTSSASHVTN